MLATTHTNKYVKDLITSLSFFPSKMILTFTIITFSVTVVGAISETQHAISIVSSSRLQESNMNNFNVLLLYYFELTSNISLT
jgi:hypothetical protein